MNLCNGCSLGGEYCNPSFGEIFKSAEGFLEAYHNCGIPTTITDESATTLFYLIYAKYGNTPIKSNDENLFVYKIFQLTFQYAPTWEKRLDIQKEYRKLSLEEGSEIFIGGRAIYNHAMNDGSAVDGEGTSTTKELEFVNDQNTTNYIKSRMEGLSVLEHLLVKDVTEELLNRYKPLFSQWLKGDIVPYFITEV